MLALTGLFFIFSQSFYNLRPHIDDYTVFAASVLVFITFYLLVLNHRNSEHRTSFYYFLSIGFLVLYLAGVLFILDQVFVYPELISRFSISTLLILGYASIANGVNLWSKHNQAVQSLLLHQSSTDELTGLLNRRAFTVRSEIEMRKAGKFAQPLSVMLLDFDNFKTLNDDHGHFIGDKILNQCAELMAESLRSSDSLCRWGGEEFAILLPSTNLDNARMVAEKIRKVIESRHFNNDTHRIYMTVSIGVAQWQPNEVITQHTLSRADKGLYKAKENGKNQVQAIDPVAAVAEPVS